MSKKEKGNIFIVILGAIIIGVFIPISFFNLVDGDEYYSSTDIIESIDYINGKLEIVTRDDVQAICVKRTKTEPKLDSLCWQDTINNKFSTSIYEYKTYYIWTKDVNNVISYYTKYNTKNN